jgi:hypothetical protein
MFYIRYWGTRRNTWLIGAILLVTLLLVLRSCGGSTRDSGLAGSSPTTTITGTQNPSEIDGAQDTLPGGESVPTTLDVTPQIVFEALPEQISFPSGGANVLQQSGPSAEQVEKLRTALGSGELKETKSGWEGDGLVILKTGSFKYENPRQKDPGAQAGCSPGSVCIPQSGSTLPAPSAGLPSDVEIEAAAQKVFSTLGAPSSIDTRVRDQWRGYVRASVRAESVNVGFAVVIVGDGGVVLAANGPIGNWTAGRAFGLLSAQDSYKSIKNTGKLIRKGTRAVGAGESASMENAFRCGATQTKNGITETIPAWCFQDRYGNVWRVVADDAGVPFADNPQDGYNFDTTPGTTTPQPEEVSDTD